jgi:hypothetical protein
VAVRFSPGNVLVRSTSIPDHREDWTACGVACLKGSISNDTFIVGFRAGATEHYVLLGIGFGTPSSVLKLQINGTPVPSTFAPQLDVPFRWAIVHAADTFYLYVDEVLVASQLFVTSGDAAATWFGVATTSTTGSDSANVVVQWLKLFAAALSAAECATETHSPRVIRGSSIYGAYVMASGATAGTDSSGNGNHMTAVGSPADADPLAYAATLEDDDNGEISRDVWSDSPMTTGAHFLGEPAVVAAAGTPVVKEVWRDPPSTVDGDAGTAGNRLHGEMVDYDGKTEQGFDNKLDQIGYLDSRNIGRALVVTGPVDISPGSRAYRQPLGVISTETVQLGNEGVDRFSILTVYKNDTPFVNGQSLVPGYVYPVADEDFVVFGDILLDRLPDFALSTGVFSPANIAEWTANVRRTRGPDHNALPSGSGARSILARSHWGAYYQTDCRSGSAAACLMMSEHRNDTVVAAIVQAGMHVMGFLRNGIHFYGNPGHTTGRLELLLLAAILLDRQDWIDLAIRSAPGVKRVWESHSQIFTIHRMRSVTTSSIGTSPAPFQYDDECAISGGGTCRWRGGAAGGVVWYGNEAGGAVANGVTLTGPDGQTAVVNGTPTASTLHYGEGNYAANPAYEGRPEYHRVAWSNGQWGNGSNRPAIGSSITWLIPYRRGEDSSTFGMRLALYDLLPRFATNGLNDFGGPDPTAVFAYIKRYHEVEQGGGPEPPSEPGSTWPPNERGLSPPEVELFNPLTWPADPTTGALVAFGGARATMLGGVATSATAVGAGGGSASLTAALSVSATAVGSGGASSTIVAGIGYSGVLVGQGGANAMMVGTVSIGGTIAARSGGSGLVLASVSSGPGGGGGDPPAPRPRPMPVPRESKRRPRWRTFGGW